MPVVTTLRIATKFLVAIAIFLAFLWGAPGVSGEAQVQNQFSATPRFPLNNDDMSRGKDVQRFSGAFVKRLSEDWSSSADQNCLRSLDDSTVELETFGSGEIRLGANAPSCFAPNKPTAYGAVSTSAVTLSASRVLALTLVASRFSQEPRFATNDRDLSHYDVEIYGTDNSLKVLLQAPPSDSSVAGCPPTGPIDAAYFVDLKTFAVKLGRIVC